jgi:hypothetical protein
MSKKTLCGEILQCRRQVNVSVRNLKFVAKRLEFFNYGLCQIALKTDIPLAAKNPAARETIIISRAFILDLITASAGCHLFQVFAPDFLCEKKHFRRGNEQPMAKCLEIAAFPASIAYACFRPMSRNLLIEPLIYGFHSLDYFLIYFHIIV